MLLPPDILLSLFLYVFLINPFRNLESKDKMSDATPDNPVKKKRNLAGNPDPDAEVIALSPKTLMAKNRFLCDVCNKGFQRDQNLQLHRRGHNLPWKLKQRPSSQEAVRKKVYVCPEASCVHNHPSRALGDLTGIKKHFSRKHGEKKYGCDRCSKKYAVRCDWKAHSKTCGTREYKCDCGTIFSRRDSFVTHRAFCDALADEGARSIRANPTNVNVNPHPLLFSSNVLDSPCQFPNFMTSSECNNADDHHGKTISLIKREQHFNVGQFHSSSLLPLIPSAYNQMPPSVTASSPHLSATVLLQKAAEMGTTSMSRQLATQMAPHTTSATNLGFGVGLTATHSPLLQEVLMMSSDNSMEMTKNDGGLTRDFLGLEAFSHKDVLFTIDEYIDDTCMRSSFEE